MDSPSTFASTSWRAVRRMTGMSSRLRRVCAGHSSICRPDITGIITSDTMRSRAAPPARSASPSSPLAASSTLVVLAAGTLRRKPRISGVVLHQQHARRVPVGRGLRGVAPARRLQPRREAPGADGAGSSAARSGGSARGRTHPRPGQLAQLLAHVGAPLGSRTWKVEPFPCSLVTSMPPACSSSVSFTSARPMPVPPKRRVPLASAGRSGRR